MVTLQDVAREAGVAVSTVSRALTQPERISPPTRARVQEVARRLGYRPNRIARAVVSGRTQMLAVLVPDITNPHHFGLIRGAEERARAADRTLVLGDTRGDPGLEADHLDRLGSVVDGIVLASSRLPDADLRRPRPAPPGRAAQPRAGRAARASSTDFDDGIRQVVAHLAALGHRRVAYLSGPRRAWSEGAAGRGLSAAAAAAGVDVQRASARSRPPLDGGPAAADAGLASGATALVAYNDLLAIGVLRRLEERGVAVPETRERDGLRRHLRRRLLPPAADHGHGAHRGGRPGAGRRPARRQRARRGERSCCRSGCGCAGRPAPPRPIAPSAGQRAATGRPSSAAALSQRIARVAASSSSSASTVCTGVKSASSNGWSVPIIT